LGDYILCFLTFLSKFSVSAGPACPRKHVRKVACQLYLTGFCPLGPECSRGQ
jgi:hypothetical protein